MQEKAIILGCGPAGLLAAHAAALSGVDDLVIISRKRRSPIGGAQYLHREIPGITDSMDPSEVTFVKKGSAAVYAKKVYGDMSAITSWDLYAEGKYEIWNMRQAYDILWDMYEPLIVDAPVDYESVRAMSKEGQVISTIPKRAACPNPEAFVWQSQPVWLEYGTNVPTSADDMEIVYSGLVGDRWYRQSNMFGWRGIEYPAQQENAVEVSKPLYTSFEGDPDVIYAGRYGEWKKGVLVHDAFEKVINYYGW